MQEETTVPVYFSPETEELREIYDDLVHGASGDQANSAWEGELSRSRPAICSNFVGAAPMFWPVL